LKAPWLPHYPTYSNIQEVHCYHMACRNSLICQVTSYMIHFSSSKQTK
jgi:hypothetical protein